MYDKTKIVGYSVEDFTRLGNNPNIEKAKEEYNKETGEFTGIKGRLRNLDIKVKPHFIEIEGSLSKFKNGENITPFTLLNTKEVITEIGDLLCIDMANTYPTEMEFGANIITSNEVANYLQCLGERPYYIKSGFSNNTVYYTNDAEQYKCSLKFYDKTKQALKVGMNIPEAFKNKNILRIEARKKGRLAYQTGAGQRLTTEMLYNPQFYYSQKQQLIKDYQTIKKYQDMEIDYTCFRKPSDCKEVLFTYLVKLNPSIVAQFMENVKAAGVYDRQQMRRAKEGIVNVCKNGIILSNDLIQELDNKIVAIMDYD